MVLHHPDPHFLRVHIQVVMLKTQRDDAIILAVNGEDIGSIGHFSPARRELAALELGGFGVIMRVLSLLFLHPDLVLLNSLLDQYLLLKVVLVVACSGGSGGLVIGCGPSAVLVEHMGLSLQN